MLVLASLAAPACVHTRDLSASVSFDQFSVKPGETICLRDISPLTSIVIQRYLRSTFTAEYSLNEYLSYPTATRNNI
jgi:hypothetical protein